MAPAVLPATLATTRTLPCARPSSRQGKALGLVANIESLSAIVSPVVWGYVYRASVGWSAGLAFFADGAHRQRPFVGEQAPPDPGG